MRAHEETLVEGDALRNANMTMKYATFPLMAMRTQKGREQMRQARVLVTVPLWSAYQPAKGDANQFNVRLIESWPKTRGAHRRKKE